MLFSQRRGAGSWPEAHRGTVTEGAFSNPRRTERPAGLRRADPRRWLAGRRPGDGAPRIRNSRRASGPSLVRAAALAIACASLLTGQPATLLRDALLIDGSGSPPVPNADILLVQGKVKRVGPTGTLSPPSEARVFDAAGKTVIPGLINLRGLAGHAGSPERAVNRFDREETLASLRVYASYGVTTTSTLGPDRGVLRELRAGVEAGRIGSASRLLSPLRILNVSASNHERVALPDGVSEELRTADEARAAVERLADEGADFVEIRVAAGYRDANRLVAVAAAAIQSASRHRLPVAVVAPEQSTAAALVRAGARVVAGSVRDGEVADGFVALLLEADAVYAPALAAEAAQFEFGDNVPWLGDRYLRRSLQSGIVGQLRGPVGMRQALDPDRALRIRRYATASRNLRRLATAGVTIGLASGSGFEGTFEGFTEYLEAVRMKRAGLSPMEVIRAFSRGSATALGIESERGLVKPGFLADLVVLNGNPLENIHNLRELHAVFIGGRLARL